MSITANISSKVSAPKQELELGRDLQRGGDVPQFDQVMNLVQPKVAQEAVKAYESNAQERTKVEKEPAREHESQGVQSDKQKKIVESDTDTKSVSHDQISQASQSSVAEVEGQRNKIIHMVSQLSQEDLLSIIEWRGDLGLQAGALDTQLSIDHLPKVDGISTSDVMALLNGFKQLEIPTDQLPSLDGPQLASWLEAQWDASKVAGAQRAIMMSHFAPEMNQQQAFNANTAALMSMEAVARPSEVMPALNLLKLSQGQKEGILKQVAQGFKAQRGGTQSVNIRLHPEELGAVRLKVEVQGQEVRLFFSAENAGVNELIQQNLDELRAMLLEKEFNLTEAGLFQDQLGQGEQSQAEDEGEDYGSDDRPNLKRRPKNSPKLSPLPGRFRATV